MPVDLAAPLATPSQTDLALSNVSAPGFLLRLLTVALVTASAVLVVFSISGGPIADTEQQHIVGP